MTLYFICVYLIIFSWASVSICQNICKLIQFPVKFAFTSTIERQGRLIPSGKKKSKIVFHCRLNSTVLRHLPWQLCKTSTITQQLPHFWEQMFLFIRRVSPWLKKHKQKWQVNRGQLCISVEEELTWGGICFCFYPWLVVSFSCFLHNGLMLLSYVLEISMVLRVPGDCVTTYYNN